MKKHSLYLIGFLLIFILASCNTTKHLQPGEYLVKKNKISLDVDLKRSDYNSLEYQLSTINKQKPNAKFLRLFRTRLWLHYRLEKKYPSDSIKVSKIDKFIQRRVAQKPVIFNEDITENTTKTMQYYLNNKGYFDAKVNYEIDTVRKKFVKVKYNIVTDKVLSISSINFRSPDSKIDTILQDISSKSLLKIGSPIDKQLFNKEKNRLTNEFRNRGYLYFYPNYIHFVADSTNQKAVVEVDVTPPKDAALHPYRIGKITVHTDYLPARSIYAKSKKINYKGFDFIKIDSSNFDIKLEPIANAIQLKSGDLYAAEAQTETSKKLSLLNVYKFISIKFAPKEKPDRDGIWYMDCDIYLTPQKKMEAGADLEFNMIDDQSFGRGVGTFFNLNYKNRNVFRGAELFNLSGGLGVEFLGVKNENDRTVLQRNTFEARIASDFYFPSISLRNAPLRASLSYNFIDRNNQFTYDLLNLASGFDWELSRTSKLSADFINLNYLRPTIAPEFQETLDNDPLLASSFAPQLIPSFSLGYVYQGLPSAKGDSWVFNSAVDISGTTFNLLESFIPNLNIQFQLVDDNTQDTTTIIYSQFIRFDFDLRYTKKQRRNSFALRLNTGIGNPWGNSANIGLPYVKQFFSGGNSSMRAWRVRGLGPGSWVDYSNYYSNVVPFQTGDFKLEINAEYRFSLKAIYSTMEGAFFVDVGNVWTITDQDERRRLKWNFYEELAVASGFGLRLDFDFFLIRFDLGWRVRYPYADDNGKHWFTRPPLYTRRPFAPRVQFGIGYPF